MLKKLLLISTVLLSQVSHANLITLDFDSIPSGSDLMTSDLVTSAGTISLTNATSISSTSAGAGNGVFHSEMSNSDPATFSFDFDVFNISFNYSGNGSGVFNLKAFDKDGLLVDSFFDPDTNNDNGTLAFVSGTGIRSFSFGDYPAGGSFASIDNVILSTSASIPEPMTSLLFLLGLTGFVIRARK